MNTKHTPGPLTVSRDKTYLAQWNVVRSYGHQPNAEQAGVGHVMVTARCYSEADAILYAAAPELLEALHALKLELEFITGHEAGETRDELVERLHQDWDGKMRKAGAAIAKATGGTK